jgi:hypothetical protein
MTTIQIKKDGQDPQVINVPEGAKIIIEDGITIVEPEFKDGDIVFGLLDENPWIGIYKNKIGFELFNYHARFLINRVRYSDFVSILLCQRHATESEKQLLFDAIAKDGKQWNPDTKKIEELKYIPKEGDCVEYWFSDRPLEKGYCILNVVGEFVYKKGTFIGCISGKVKSNKYDNISECLFRKITPEELQAKFNELGYEYNFETHTAEKLRWFPKKGETYYYPDQFCYSLYRSAINDTDSFDKKCIELKLAFKTPEEAIEVSKRWLQQL